MNPRDWLRFIFGTGFKRQPESDDHHGYGDPELNAAALEWAERCAPLAAEVILVDPAPPTNRGDNE